jgi:hypothetical protein
MVAEHLHRTSRCSLRESIQSARFGAVSGKASSESSDWVATMGAEIANTHAAASEFRTVMPAARCRQGVP